MSQVRARFLRPFTVFLLGLIIAWFLWRSLRTTPLTAVLQTLRHLTWGEIAILTAVNTVVVLILSGRWWAILRGFDSHVPYLRLSGYRLAAFAVSYFTPGPQFGGEPLQVVFLKQSGVHGVTATSSVAIDKALELLGNFTFLAFGALVILRLQFLPRLLATPLLGMAVFLLLLPLLFLGSAWLGKRPLSFILMRLPGWLARRLPGVQKVSTFVQRVEIEMTTFCQREPRALTLAMGFSLLIWLVLLGEYWLMLHFMGVDLTVWQTVGVLTGARFAFLTPLPGGVGAVEASQILALTSLGYLPAQGISVGLLIRGRDLLFGGVGALLGGLYLPSRSRDG